MNIGNVTHLGIGIKKHTRLTFGTTQYMHYNLLVSNTGEISILYSARP